MFDTPEAFLSKPGSPLTELMARFGRRLPELAFEPGLVAAVDQHAAAVRDAVGGTHRLARFLPDYVLGFMDALGDMDWHEHEGYDFAALRLTAVCWLVREHGLSAAAS